MAVGEGEVSIPEVPGSLPGAPWDSDALASTPETINFPIVGIGASAGGLGAFEAFFSGMPAGADPGIAFVLVQHLTPDRESLLVTPAASMSVLRLATCLCSTAACI